MGQRITVRLQDDVLREARHLLSRSNLKTRTAYVNEAVKRMNRLLARQELAEAFAEQSKLVRKRARQCWNS